MAFEISSANGRVNEGCWGRLMIVSNSKMEASWDTIFWRCIGYLLKTRFNIAVNVVYSDFGHEQNSGEPLKSCKRWSKVFTPHANVSVTKPQSRCRQCYCRCWRQCYIALFVSDKRPVSLSAWKTWQPGASTNIWNLLRSWEWSLLCQRSTHGDVVDKPTVDWLFQNWAFLSSRVHHLDYAILHDRPPKVKSSLLMLLCFEICIQSSIKRWMTSSLIAM